MRLPTRLKTRLDTRIPARMRSSIARYFRRNEGSTDYISIPEIVFDDDFEVECNICPINDRFHLLASSTSTVRLYYEYGGFVIQTIGQSLRFTHKLTTGKFVNIKISRVSGSVSMVIGGVTAPKTSDGANGDAVIIDTILGKWGIATSLPNMSGIIYGLTIKSGSLIRNYPINDNGNTIHDTVSGQDGTVINGNPDDWGLFKKLPNGNWQGVDLSDSWDSPDQILEVV